jgi:preprotein translocase subunit Sec63
MLRSIVRKIRATTTQTLFRKNIYHMNNEVPRFDSSKNYYSILEIHKESSESEVKQAYYRLAKAYHPDSNPGK